MKDVYVNEDGKVIADTVGFAVTTGSTLTLILLNPAGTASTKTATLVSTASGSWSYTTAGDEFTTEGEWLGQIKVQTGTTTTLYGPIFPIRVMNAIDE